MRFLQNHPFAVKAFFERSLVLTYATKPAAVSHLIPECLRLDTYHDQYAFVAAAFVQTKGLRPAAFPAFMGNDFFLAGYRIFVRFGKLRGLYILKSETDKRKMTMMGNVFTHYNYTLTDIDYKAEGDILSVTSKQSGINVQVDTSQSTHSSLPALPAGSPFPDWKSARAFAGPLPFTFTYDAARKEVLIIEGQRQNWTPRPVTVLHHHVNFVEEMQLPQLQLANAFLIENVPYRWKKGRIERWEGAPSREY
jgi:uncharacterized protein YqjF (DUF2071 family)